MVSNDFGAIQKTTYDLKDRPQYVTDANGVTITNTYDNLDRLLTRGYPDGGVEKFGYSARGMIAYTNQIGMTNFYAYDAAGRLTFATNANDELLRYTNDAAGDLLSLTDGNNHTTQWHYDQYGRVTNKVDQAGSVILKYYYDAGDRLTNRWSTAKGATYYSYDALGNLTNIDYPSSHDASFAYDALSRLTKRVARVDPLEERETVETVAPSRRAGAFTGLNPTVLMRDPSHAAPWVFRALRVRLLFRLANFSGLGHSAHSICVGHKP